MTRRTERRIRHGLGLTMGLCLLLACVADLGQNDAPPEGWWAQRGPVVPHGSFPADCSLCHTGDDWQTIRDDFQFDHEAETGVELEGAHGEAECLRCHNDRGPVAAFAAKGCAGCHEDVHQGQLGKVCEGCHETQSDWFASGPIADHDRTRFPLVGAHSATACWRCHPGAEVGNFTHADVECVTCHADDLSRAQNPDHMVQGWTSRCDRCHIPVAWQGAAFNHGWPLTGAHRTAACDACHVGNVFMNLPTDCLSCHQADYNGAPDHIAQNYPTDCEQCHDTSSWQGANFSHSGITTGCVNCHLDDYNQTTEPDHQAVGFPQACENCHNTSNWFGANFNHSFPINNGPHKNLDCAECHLNPNNFALFSCINCHEHNQSDMDDDHDEVQGYTYNSMACYSCHPDGKD